MSLLEGEIAEKGGADLDLMGTDRDGIGRHSMFDCLIV